VRYINLKCKRRTDRTSAQGRYRVVKMHRMSSVAGLFCKRAANYRALLRKMTDQDKGSYESLPPCMYVLIYARPIF